MVRRGVGQRFPTYESGLAVRGDAERCLRRGVLWRKTSFGTQSAEGRQYVERMLTVTTTLRLPGRSIYEYLHAACRAAVDGTPPPSLLPAPTP